MTAELEVIRKRASSSRIWSGSSVNDLPCSASAICSGERWTPDGIAMMFMELMVGPEASGEIVRQHFASRLQCALGWRLAR